MDWPFADPETCAAISLRQIVREGRAVLFVSHDEEDGCWQFMDGSDNPQAGDGLVVCLRSMLELDPSLGELADLPLGWCAWRERLGAAWNRGPKEEE